MRDAAMMLRELSYPWGPGERLKSILDRTSKMCRLSYWRTHDIWYRKARRIEHHEIEQIAEALRIKNEKAARNELYDLRLRLAKLEAKLSTGDADFYRPDADFYRDHVRSVGDLGGPMAGVKRQ